jgi:hypothetical protein
MLHMLLLQLLPLPAGLNPQHTAARLTCMKEMATMETGASSAPAARHSLHMEHMDGCACEGANQIRGVSGGSGTLGRPRGPEHKQQLGKEAPGACWHELWCRVTGISLAACQRGSHYTHVTTKIDRLQLSSSQAFIDAKAQLSSHTSAQDTRAAP